MKRFLATSLVAILALSAACSEKKAQDNAEEQGEAAKDENATPKPAGENQAPGQKLTDLYPPLISAFPFSAPDVGSLYFGVVPGGTQKFEMIWVYVVAAIPNFDAALEVPNFTSQAEFDAFMEKWAAEFKSRPEMNDALTKLQNEFSYTVDPAFLNDAAYPIPAAALEGQPNYVKLTQKFFARRYTTKAAGNTTISATINGVNVSTPVVITAYTAAQLTAGATRYNAANGATGSCFGCHGSANTSQDAFLKHSSDYLAYATDAQILNIIQAGTYPDGSLMANNAIHKFTLAGTEAVDLVGYLRSFPVSIDKLQGVPAEPAALRLRLR